MSNDPVILLSYAHSGARRVQELLAAGTELACTSGTGIIPLCGAAAEIWQRIEGQGGQEMSRLAAVTVRGLVTAQVTAILARIGKTRWCELVTANPAAAEAFLQVLPNAVFACVHRSCLDMIRAGVVVSPWGLHGRQLGPYLLSYPGNSVATLAAYWADSTEQLLSFEEANRQITRRVRYEDAVGESGTALTAMRVWLGLDVRHGATFPEQSGLMEPAAGAAQSVDSEVPLEMIPLSLRERVKDLSARLGYGPLPG